MKKMVCFTGLFCMLFFAVLAMGNVGINQSIRNESHANSKHIEAPFVRGLHKDNLCEGKEMWFSPSRGTILILCGIPDNKSWGGLIFRVTENNGEKWLADDAYECSVFVAEYNYWVKVIKRDKYMPLLNFPDIERLFKGWYFG